jgi:tRNA (guanine37-N1)-methyltransferase
MKLNALVVPREMGEAARRRLSELQLLYRGARIHQAGGFLYIPLKALPDADDALPPHRIECFEFEELQQRKTIEDLLGYTPSFDVIGELAILNASSPNPQAEAEAILSVHRNIKGVFQSAAPISGEFRTRRLTHLRGTNKTHTVYREHGLSYELDLSLVYFTPRLATERRRLAEKIKGGVVVDMFAGVGPFSILIAKKQKRARVLAVDKNRDAVKYLKKNLQRNRAENIAATLADSAHLPVPANTADYVIMNLPHSAEQFLSEAMRIIKHRGIIYYYDITPEDQLYQSSIEEMQRRGAEAGCSVEVIAQRVVRSYAPYQYNICIEARIGKN